MLPFVLVAGVVLALPGCSAPGPGFELARAQAHVQRLAGDIGSRPAGSPQARAAREYLVGQLRASGFDARVQEADAERPGLGVTTRVANIIATLPGSRSHSIALMAHYDSVPDGPGAADDASGAAVVVEAGRVLAGRRPRNFGLAIILTDAEELGLMGAAAVLKDPILGRIAAALNFEAIGSGGPVMLFETGPSSTALVEAWARFAPAPAGASFMPEIYKAISRGGDRTDLGLFRRAGIPGLDFALVGDGYTYHTPLDTPGRLDARALERAGRNTVAVVEALDREGLSGASEGSRTFFDLLRSTAVAYGQRGELLVFGLSILVGLVAWVHVIGVATRDVRPWRLALTLAWLLLGIIVVAGTAVGASWLLRATRQALHPWYAHPARYFTWLVLAALSSGWVYLRLAQWLPARARGSARAAVAWVMALPAWMALTVLAGWFASPSAYLVAWPLLAAGAALLAFPVERARWMRAASAGVLAVVGVLWLPNVALLLQFAVPELDRTPIITPIFLFPALLLAVGVLLAPPVLALLAPAANPAWNVGAAGGRQADVRGRPRNGVGIGLLVLAAVAFFAAWAAPAFTHDRPLHHVIRYLADATSGEAHWEAGANDPAAPVSGWQRGPSGSPVARVAGPLAAPFVHHAPAPTPGPAPFSVTGAVLQGSDATIEIRAVPHEPGWTLAIGLPPDVIPLQTNLAISMRRGRQVAVFQAVPPEGITFRAQVEVSDASKLRSTTVLAIGRGLPGAAWPRLPQWLPQDRDVWQARSYYLLKTEWQGM